MGTHHDMSYTLFASSNPFDAQTILDSLEIDDQNPQVPGASSVLHFEVFHAGSNPSGPLNVTLDGSIPFTYGQPFYLASLFGGDASGAEDFFNSADFGITAPAGATLITQSHTVYAAAVPEPGTLALLAVAALGTPCCRRRVRAPRADAAL